jgi:hypothetical protein
MHVIKQVGHAGTGVDDSQARIAGCFATPNRQKHQGITYITTPDSFRRNPSSSRYDSVLIRVYRLIQLTQPAFSRLIPNDTPFRMAAR